VLCVHCGLDLQAGEQRSVTVERETGGGRGGLGPTPRSLLLAALTGVGLAGIWTAVVVLTGWSLGFVAILIGLAVGLVLADQLRRGGWAWGGVAAGLAAAVLLAGKLAVVAVGQSAVAERDVQAAPAYLRAAVIKSMQEQQAFSAEVQQAIADRQQGRAVSFPAGTASLDERIATEAQAQLDQLSAAQRRTLARDLIQDTPAASLTLSGVGVVASRWDLIWIAVGIAAAAGAADLHGRRLARRAPAGHA
jgi:hypothetical protein